MISLLSQADIGPIFEARLLPLNGKGALRIYYDWLYSALVCSPGDTSDFIWTITKLSDTQVSLSPRNGHLGMTLYVSVRDDWDWYVQVQAPHSADWITAVGADETAVMESKGLLTVSFMGFNGQYIAVNDAISDHAGISGYRLQSTGAADPKACIWFLGIVNLLQPALRAPLAAKVSDDDIRNAFGQNGLAASDQEIAWLTGQVNGSVLASNV